MISCAGLVAFASLSTAASAAPHPAPAWAVELVWYVVGAGLLVYVLTGGADFGAGLWDLLATGPRAKAQRSAIERAIAPLWEANHVWLIFVIVVVFTVFPDAFANIGIALHVPIALALVGIVLRGSAFVFRAYGLDASARKLSWGRVFAWASVSTPLFLGMTLGGMASGLIVVDKGVVTSGYWAGWTTPFAIGLGLFALALFSLLAATYLCVDGPPELRSDFKRRALLTELVAGLISLMVLWRAKSDAPLLWQRLREHDSFGVAQVGVALVALFAMAALYANRFRLARAAAVAQVSCVVLLWGRVMEGDLLLNESSIHDAGARAETLAAVLPTLVIGFALTVPALAYLFRVFRTQRRHLEEGEASVSNATGQWERPNAK